MSSVSLLQTTPKVPRPGVYFRFISWYAFLVEWSEWSPSDFSIKDFRISISQLSDWDIQIRESLARKIALQVTQGIAYLHLRGICHGNLTSSDILFQLANFDAWSQEKVYKQLGIPMVIDVDESLQRPSLPRYLVDTAQFFRASPGLLTENIRIIDYGDSFRVKLSNNLNTNEKPS